jgi:hypothetical protein
MRQDERRGNEAGGRHKLNEIAAFREHQFATSIRGL